MVVLPRLARALHHPGIAALLGLVLIGIGIYGLASGHIPHLWSIVILVVGGLNVFRMVVKQPSAQQATTS